MKWIKESNRWKHLVGVMVVSMFGTILMGIGCIAGMEFKDVHHSHGNASKPLREWNWEAWDWWDVVMGMIGGVIGQAAQLGTIIIVMNLFK